MEKKITALLKRVNPRIFCAEPIQRCRLEECHGACCIFGVWVDEREVKDILRNFSIIQPFLPEDCRDPQDWFAGCSDIDPRSPSGTVIHTAVETKPEHYGGTACIFWLSDGKCALQVAATSNGYHPWRFKPFYCILHPLDLDEEGRFTVDDVDEVKNETGSCLVPAEAPIPFVLTFEPELRYFFGDANYELLKSYKPED